MIELTYSDLARIYTALTMSLIETGVDSQEEKELIPTINKIRSVMYNVSFADRDLGYELKLKGESNV